MSYSYILSEFNEWYTPKSVVDYFGKFDYDPATTDEKAKEFGIKVYDTILTDGLKRDWSKFKRIWLNPPFTRKKEFIQKAVETFNKVHNEIYIVIPINYLTTKELHKIVKGALIFIPNGRIKFYKANDKKSSPVFGTVILKLQDTWELKVIDMNDLEDSIHNLYGEPTIIEYDETESI